MELHTYISYRFQDRCNTVSGNSNMKSTSFQLCVFSGDFPINLPLYLPQQPRGATLRKLSLTLVFGLETSWNGSQVKTRWGKPEISLIIVRSAHALQHFRNSDYHVIRQPQCTIEYFSVFLANV